MIDPDSIGRCRECGAMVRPEVTACWLCASRLAEQEERRELEENPFASPRPSSEEMLEGSSVSGATLIVTLLLVTLGVWLVAPGIAVLLAVAIVPALVRTLLVLRRRSTLGLETTRAKRVEMFLLSAVTVVVIAVAAIGAAFVALVASCFVALASAGAGATEDAVWVVFGVGQILALLVVGSLALTWARQRWRQDTTENSHW